MNKLTPTDRRKREAAHAAAAQSQNTLWPDWPHAISSPKRNKKVRQPLTPRFKIARAYRSGHGLMS